MTSPLSEGLVSFSFAEDNGSLRTFEVPCSQESIATLGKLTAQLLNVDKASEEGLL